MSFEIVKEFPHDLIFDRSGACISLYQPTHRYRPANIQDLTRYKNLCQEIKKSLESNYNAKEIEQLMKPLYDIAEDRLFWNKTKDGLAIFCNKNKCIVYVLNRPLTELAVVSDSFHIKPLIRVFQSADTYYVLGFNMKNFKLFRGNRYVLEEIEFDEEDTPISIEDVLGEGYKQASLNFGSYGGAAGGTMYHGHGGKKDEIDNYVKKYFKYIDKLVLENFSNPTQAPLVLAALDENQGMFRKITSNNHILDDGIKVDFETLDIKELRDRSWKIVEKSYLEKTKVLVERFNNLRSKDLSTNDLATAIKEGLNGRIETLLLESDKIIPGKIDPKNGDIKRLEKNNNTDDLLDDLAEIVFSRKGEVVMLPSEKMPTDTGLAAIYRY